MVKKRNNNKKGNKDLNLFQRIYIDLFSKQFNLKFKNISELYKEEMDTYYKLKYLFKGNKLNNNNLIVYNPGGGHDITTILLVLDAIAKKNVNINIIYQEIRNHFNEILFELKRITKSPIIIEKKNNNKKYTKYIATAYYKNKRITITYYISSIENIIPKEIKEGYDIYYERAFQFFRSNNGEYLYNVSKFLKPNGLMISDYGFDFNKFQKKEFKKLKKIPKDYGMYKKFQIWQKVK